jgi:hypothetical protein
MMHIDQFKLVAIDILQDAISKIKADIGIDGKMFLIGLQRYICDQLHDSAISLLKYD